MTMYYAGPQGRLYAEPHTLPTAPDDPQLAALQEWWTSTPLDPDLVALVIPNPNLQVVDISQAGHATTIEIEGIEGSDPRVRRLPSFRRRARRVESAAVGRPPSIKLCCAQRESKARHGSPTTGNRWRSRTAYVLTP
ncbi:MAG: hypothetical protein WKF73_06155 [Nocardioidaceae bacterium]